MARGDTTQRGYGHAHQRARRLVLARDRLCTECRARPSVAAHHDPPLVERRGGHVSDPAKMRGVCGPCHKELTAELNRQLLRQRHAQDEIDHEPGVAPPPERGRRRPARVYPGALDIPFVARETVDVVKPGGIVVRVKAGRRYEP